MAEWIWFREQIVGILRAAMAGMNGAASLTPQDQTEADAYHRGYQDAILAVAAGFNLDDYHRKEIEREGR